MYQIEKKIKLFFMNYQGDFLLFYCTISLILQQIKVSLFGWDIVTKSGRQLYKYLSIVAPLLPTLALIVYNGFELESLYRRSMSLDREFAELQNSITISILVSKLQDERYNMAFRTLSNTKGSIHKPRGHQK